MCVQLTINVGTVQTLCKYSLIASPFCIPVISSSSPKSDVLKQHTTSKAWLDGHCEMRSLIRWDSESRNIKLVRASLRPFVNFVVQRSAGFVIYML